MEISTILQDSGLTEQDIKNLLVQNKKIEAVKLVHNATGLGLLESKNLVENIHNSLSNFNSSGKENTNQITITQKDKIEILNLLKEHKKINAVQFVKNITGWNLKDSKDFIDSIENNPSKIETLKFSKSQIKRKSTLFIENKPFFSLKYILIILAVFLLFIYFAFLKK